MSRLINWRKLHVIINKNESNNYLTVKRVGKIHNTNEKKKQLTKQRQMAWGIGKYM